MGMSHLRHFFLYVNFKYALLASIRLCSLVSKSISERCFEV